MTDPVEAPSVAATAAETVMPDVIQVRSLVGGETIVGPTITVSSQAVEKIPTFFPVTPNTPQAAKAFNRMLDGKPLEDPKLIKELRNEYDAKERDRLSRMVEEAE